MRQIKVSFDNDEHVFEGYTEGHHWNGFECPWFTLRELRRVLARLVEFGEEAHFIEIDPLTVKVVGPDGADYMLTAERYEEGKPLFYMGGGYTFLRADDDPRPSVALDACWFCGERWGSCSCGFKHHDEDPNAPGFEHDGMFITCPNVSECARFMVNPLTHYGEAFITWIGTQPNLLRKLSREKLVEIIRHPMVKP